MKINAPQVIKKFLEYRVRIVSSSLQGVSFNVIEGGPRKIQFNDTFSSCTLSAADISNLDNIYNKIGLLQAFYRFVGFHALLRRIFLLHGSSAIYRGKAILFGDNGKSIGKTFASLEVGLKSKRYIADEFVFWNENSRIIFSDNNIPIHVRNDVQKHFQDAHAFNVTQEFISPQYFGFQLYNHKILDTVCYVNFIHDKEKALILPKALAYKYALKTFTAHLEKMFNPKLDRFQFLDQCDKELIDKANRTNLVMPNAYFNALPQLKAAARHFINCVRGIELFVRTPCSIPNLIDTILK